MDRQPPDRAGPRNLPEEPDPSGQTESAESTLLASLPAGGTAIVIGASGAIGGALQERLQDDARIGLVIGLSRNGTPPLDLTSEQTIADVARRLQDTDVPLRLVIDATGVLHGDGVLPEKTWRQMDAERMARAFAVNAIGPALLMKHFLPLLARDGKSVFATLSARVGSIGDNDLGGWYSYRASKAALNQLVRTASIELRRRAPEAICIALHPGTVDSGLSAPFEKTGLAVRRPAEASEDLLRVIDALDGSSSGGFVDYRGSPVPY